MMDKISDLKKFIEVQIADEVTYEYELYPNIRYDIEHFNKEESKRFSEEIWSWGESILFHLADPVLGANNQFLDRCFIYCKIFSLTTDVENAHYLGENLASAFEYVDIKYCSLEFLESFKSKMIEMYDFPNPTLTLAQERIDNILKNQ